MKKCKSLPNIKTFIYAKPFYGFLFKDFYPDGKVKIIFELKSLDGRYIVFHYLRSPSTKLNAYGNLGYLNYKDALESFSSLVESVTEDYGAFEKENLEYRGSENV